MRCIALAQAWRRACGSAIFVSAEITSALEARITGKRFQFVRLNAMPGSTEDAARTVEIARMENASWVVADGYHFGQNYQCIVKATGLSLLLLDDCGHAEHYSADFVLNQNLLAREELYKNREPHTRLLLGTQYVLLREEFFAYRGWQREIPVVARKLLITLGGADHENVTHKVIQALVGLRNLRTTVVVGGSNAHLDKLKLEISNLKSEIRLVVDATNMPELMAQVDVAIASGGITLWELAFMGVPTVVLVLAENQRAIAATMDTANAARQSSVERLEADVTDLLGDTELRRALNERGRQLVDSYGAGRVVTCLCAAGLELRRVRPEDSRLLWEWANEPEVRAVSFWTAPITWEVHQKWFAEHVNSPNCLFYFATNSNNEPVGQIRYDISGATAVVSISLDKQMRRGGNGSALIRRGSEQCFADSSVNLICAFTKLENEPSVRAFLKAGFTDDGMIKTGTTVMRRFVMRRECIP